MIKAPLTSNENFNWRKQFQSFRYPSLVIGIVIILGVITFVFFPDPFINLLLKGKITNAFSEAYPKDSLKLGYLHYNIWKNRLGCDSVVLKTNDFTCKIPSLSVSGIGFTKILLHKGFTPNTLSGLIIDAQNSVIIFSQSQNEFQLGRLHISFPDSEIVADSIKYYSLLNDEQFFAKSQFRQTRFRIKIPLIRINSLDCLAMLRGIAVKAKNININEASTDILVNMDKPYDKNSANPQMPNEAFASIKESVKIDSLIILNGQLIYCERYTAGAKPGVVSINKINISAGEISNLSSKPGTTIIRGEGLLLTSTKINLFMAIPFNSKEFSLQYSGSLGRMDVTELNSFIEPGEHQRIKTGTLQSASFNININSGIASGILNADYKDLTIDAINKETGSEKGILNRITSLFDKLFIVRGSNLPDKQGSIKIGQIIYKRDPEDYFFQFIWFAVRNGVADIVGFPKK
ncbi:MAG: hypothetical protein P4L35_09215 [Ignavibacteriaceae bacterium]|nr:hypothetical protein [Ignavibacteriaceae bacterium]